MSSCARHKTCIKDALQHAETLCRQNGARLTETRRHVLELLWQSHQPRKAYDLLEALEKTDPAAKPPTVYRALEFLQEMGLAHKIESLNAYIGCDGAHTHQYMICRKCGTVTDMHDEALTKAVCVRAQEKGFRVANTVIEIKGECKRC
jgi:Fur family transcriptional regulator, zinc uptake regulator